MTPKVRLVVLQKVMKVLIQGYENKFLEKESCPNLYLIFIYYLHYPRLYISIAIDTQTHYHVHNRKILFIFRYWSYFL